MRSKLAEVKKGETPSKHKVLFGLLLIYVILEGRQEINTLTQCNRPKLMAWTSVPLLAVEWRVYISDVCA